MIIRFTDLAAQHVQNTLNAQPKAVGFRLTIKKTGCSGYAYVPTLINTIDPQDWHQVIAHIPVYIDPTAVAILKGTQLDFVDKGFGHKQLVFHNPNAAGECGCGESFHLKTQREAGS